MRTCGKCTLNYENVREVNARNYEKRDKPMRHMGKYEKYEKI